MGILIYHVEINSLFLQEKEMGFAYNLIQYSLGQPPEDHNEIHPVRREKLSS